MSRAKDFGAVGDGRADDTEALQHAINDGDGTLELTKGSYRITQPLLLDTTQHGYLSVWSIWSTQTQTSWTRFGSAPDNCPMKAVMFV